MALFVLMCLDHPGALDRRMAARENHLGYVREHLAMVKVAGPMLNAAGEMAGSMFVIEAPDRGSVEAFSAADPYRLANVFERVELHPWRVTVGALA
jgi:hypothetical protein